MAMPAAQAAAPAVPRGAPVVLYDGVCGFCNATVRFILRRDDAALFRFAALQSEFARRTLSRHGRDPDGLDTMYVVVDHGEPSERVLAKSDAVIHVLRTLGGVWRVGVLGRLIPVRLRDWLYGLVVKNRYRLFGKYDSCPLPDPEVRSRFLE